MGGPGILVGVSLNADALDIVNLDAPAADPIAAQVDAAVTPESTNGAAPPAAEKPPEVKQESKEDADERVIELSRGKRESDQRAAKLEADLKSKSADLERLQPVVDLIKLAESDPLSFVTEIAEVAGLDPKRVIDVIATKGAGGEAALTVDEKVALLERQLAELKTGKKDDDEEDDKKPGADAGEQARQGFIDSLTETIKAAPDMFPHAAADPTAPEAAFLVMVRHWSANKDQPGYRPMPYVAAVRAVESALAKKATGASGAPKPPAGGGLSNSMAAPVGLPSTPKILSDAEIRAAMLADFGR